jgi:hypothetical protein
VLKSKNTKEKEKVTMSKKTKEKAKATAANAAKKAEVKVKASEPKVPDKKAPEVKAIEAPKRPEMPGNFCMEKADWDGDGVCYDPKSNGCKACAKDKEFAETIVICKARSEFLLAGKKKTAKAVGERKARVGGLIQGDVMNDALKKKMTISEIVKEVADKCYGGDSKSATSRFNRHLKSIKDGSCSKSKEMLPFVAYLSAPTAKAAKASA